MHKNIRLTTAYKNPKVKQVVNSDLIIVKRIFNEQDSYLKKRVEEILFPAPPNLKDMEGTPSTPLVGVRKAKKK